MVSKFSLDFSLLAISNGLMQLDLRNLVDIDHKHNVELSLCRPLTHMGEWLYSTKHS